MTIASALTALNTDIQNARTAITNKGGTVTSGGGSSQLATDIATIPTSGTIDSLTITPSTSSQTITASGGVDGYSPITVNAVTSSIDANITAGNIKDGVTILGVTGTYTGGITPSGSISITSNGVQDVTNYAYANVNVPNPATGTYNITLNGTYNIANYASVYVDVPSTITGYTELPSYQVSLSGAATNRNITLNGNEFSNIKSVGNYVFYYKFYNNYYLAGDLNFSSLETVGNYAFDYAFYGCSNLTTVDLSKLTSVGNYAFDYAFYGCLNLTTVDLSSLQTVSGSSAFKYAFASCVRLTTVDLSSLQTVSGSSAFDYAFDGCSVLASVDLSSLQTVSGSFKYAFRYTSLTNISFTSLSSISSSNCFERAFAGCRNITSISFPSLTTISRTDAFTQMLNSAATTSKNCVLHFPSNLQSIISGLIGYPTFGGSSSYISIAFDLPATS